MNIWSTTHPCRSPSAKVPRGSAQVEISGSPVPSSRLLSKNVAVGPYLPAQANTHVRLCFNTAAEGPHPEMATAPPSVPCALCVRGTCPGVPRALVSGTVSLAPCAPTTYSISEAWPAQPSVVYWGHYRRTLGLQKSTPWIQSCHQDGAAHSPSPTPDVRSACVLSVDFTAQHYGRWSPSRWEDRHDARCLIPLTPSYGSWALS